MWFREEDGIPVPCDAFAAEAYMRSGSGRVALDETLTWRVSTVFLPTDFHYGEELPQHYETAIRIGDGRHQTVGRTGTRSHARRMHEFWVLLMHSPLGSSIMTAAMTDIVPECTQTVGTRQFNVDTTIEAAAIALLCRAEYPQIKLTSVRVNAEGGYQVNMAGRCEDLEVFERRVPEIRQASRDKPAAVGPRDP